MSARLTIVVIAAVAAACAPSLAPSLVVPLENNDWGRYQLLIYDASGLVTDARPMDPRHGQDDVVALPERREIEIGWTGGACSHRPSLHVSGAASELRLVVRNPPDPQPLPFLPIGCPAVGVPLRVTLFLSEPVSEDAVGIEVNV